MKNMYIILILFTSFYFNNIALSNSQLYFVFNYQNKNIMSHTLENIEHNRINTKVFENAKYKLNFSLEKLDGNSLLVKLNFYLKRKGCLDLLYAPIINIPWQINTKLSYIDENKNTKSEFSFYWDAEEN